MIGEKETMAADTKADLEVSRYLAWFHSNGIHGPWSCLQCNATIRKPRYLKYGDGRRHVTLTWCSQDCIDAWNARFHLPAMCWEKYDQDGILIGYVVPRRGFVSLQEIDEAREKER